MPPSAAPVNERESSSPNGAAARSPAHGLSLLLLIAVGIALRVEALARKPFWSDECFSVEIAWIDWRNFMHLMLWREANMSLSYVHLRNWLTFGLVAFYIRTLSVF